MAAIELQAFGSGRLAHELAAPLLLAPDTPRSYAALPHVAPPPSPSEPPPRGAPPIGASPLAPQWDSFSYGAWHSVVYDAFMAAKHRWHFRKVTALRWTVNFFLGALVALVAVAITFCSRYLAEKKFAAMDALIAVDKENGLYALCAFLGLLGISLAYVGVAAVAVAFVEPVAGGSGIPEIKTILNGVKLPRVLRLKTLLCKVVGNAFSVASGLPVGKEGPMIHSGACVAAALTQGRAENGSRSCSVVGILMCDCIPRSALRNDKEKSEFISCGAAAGVASAFGAPIGGLLFTIEEGTTHWFRALVWRIFFCTMVASYFTSLLNSGIAGDWGNLGNPGMFNFGGFDVGATWTIQELPLYMMLGAYGGIQGALFVTINRRLSLWRFANVPIASPVKRFFEALFVAAVVCAFTFGLSYALGSCAPRPQPDPSEPYAADLVSFYCSSNEFNELASLFMVSSENAIKQLFHSPRAFSLGNLALFYIVYTSLSCLTYGIAVPSGLFIPALLSGSALGRLVGEILHAGLDRIDPGTYSLIGAAAVLGGATRMTVSLAVILLETTGNYQLGLPLMATLITARFVGNMFNEGVYDLHIDLRGWPLLPEHLPKHVTKGLCVRDAMATPPRCISEVARAGDVLDLLRDTKHNGFPVIHSEAVLRAYPRIGSLAGLIERKHLSCLIAKRAFYPHLPTHATPRRPSSEATAQPHGRAAAYRLVVGGVQALGLLKRGGAAVGIGNVGDAGGLLSPVASAPTPRALPVELSAMDSSVARPTRPPTILLGSSDEGRETGVGFVSVADVLERPYPGPPLVEHATIEARYPHYPDVDGIVLSAEERSEYIDLRPYLNPAPAIVHVCAPLETAYAAFKSLALRHLLAVNDCGDVTGVLTRHDFMLPHLHECLRLKADGEHMADAVLSLPVVSGVN